MPRLSGAVAVTVGPPDAVGAAVRVARRISEPLGVRVAVSVRGAITEPDALPSGDPVSDVSVAQPVGCGFTSALGLPLTAGT